MSGDKITLRNIGFKHIIPIDFFAGKTSFDNIALDYEDFHKIKINNFYDYFDDDSDDDFDDYRDAIQGHIVLQESDRDKTFYMETVKEIVIKDLNNEELLVYETSKYNEADFNDVKVYCEGIQNIKKINAFYEKQEHINKNDKKIPFESKIRDFPKITELLVDYIKKEVYIEKYPGLTAYNSDDSYDNYYYYDYWGDVALLGNISVILVPLALVLSNIYLYLPMYLTKSTKTFKTLHKVTKYVTFIKLVVWCAITILLAYRLLSDYLSFIIIFLIFPCLFLIGNMVFVELQQIHVKLKLKLIIDSCCWIVWLIFCLIYTVVHRFKFSYILEEFDFN